MKKDYMVYDQNDEIVCVGDAVTCANFLGITRKYFSEALCRKSKVKHKYRIYEIEEDENE